MKNFDIKCVSCKTVSQFEFNDEYSEIKCLSCGYVFTGGKDELMRLNSEMYKSEIEDHLKDDTEKSAKDFLG